MAQGDTEPKPCKALGFSSGVLVQGGGHPAGISAVSPPARGLAAHPGQVPGELGAMLDIELQQMGEYPGTGWPRRGSKCRWVTATPQRRLPCHL